MPSKRRALETLARDLQKQTTRLNDQLYDLTRRMREYNYEEDDDTPDPRAEMRAQRDMIDVQIQSLWHTIETSPDDRTPEEIEEDDEESECARYDAEDRRTREAEDGYPSRREAMYESSYGDD